MPLEIGGRADKMPRNERKFEIMIKILFVCHGNITYNLN